MLEIPGQPVFHAIFCLLGVAFEAFCQVVDEIVVHFRFPYIVQMPLALVPGRALGAADVRFRPRLYARQGT